MKYIATFIIALLIGCGTIQKLDESPTAQLVIRYAVMKVIEESTDPFSRAATIVDISEKVLGILAEKQTVTTIPDLDTVVRGLIDWESLTPADRILVDSLLLTIEDDLNRKIELQVISPNQIIEVVDLIRTVQSTAAMMSTKAE